MGLDWIGFGLAPPRRSGSPRECRSNARLESNHNTLDLLAFGFACFLKNDCLGSILRL
jgi:hypothetical protein